MSLKKTCTKCNIELDIDCFNKNKTGLYGYFSQCKKCVGMLAIKRRLDNPKKYKENRKKTYLKNRENNIKKAVEWGKNNVDKRNIAKRKWRDKNKEKTNHYTKQYIYRKKGATGKHTINEWKELCDMFGNVCLCCLKKEKLTKDHIIPLTKGGTDNIENIQPLCVSCNSKKSNRNTIDYRENFINGNERY